LEYEEMTQGSLKKADSSGEQFSVYLQALAESNKLMRESAANTAVLLSKVESLKASSDKAEEKHDVLEGKMMEKMEALEKSVNAMKTQVALQASDLVMLKRVVFGGVAIVLASVLGAVLALVIMR
jgi:hypothetical protein